MGVAVRNSTRASVQYNILLLEGLLKICKSCAGFRPIISDKGLILSGKIYILCDFKTEVTINYLLVKLMSQLTIIVSLGLTLLFKK